MRTRAVVATALTLALIAGLAAYLGLREAASLRLPALTRACTVQADGQVRLTRSQMANAATIAAVGIRRQVPPRAVVVALATAFQESGLENLAGGDRDSIGLFQQRPSQGWGTPEQIRDPRYAAGKFYDGLRRVEGWEQMRVTDAAQAVQRSAFPEAYEKWADEAQVLARALNGAATGAVACTVTDPKLRGTAAASALIDGMRLDWGRLEAEPHGDLTGWVVAADDDQAGWRYAHWLVSHAGEHGVRRVHFGELQWTAEEGAWSPAQSRAPATTAVVAEVFTAA